MANCKSHLYYVPMVPTKVITGIGIICLWCLSSLSADAQTSDEKGGITVLLGAGLGAGSAGDGYGVGFAGPSIGVGLYLDPNTTGMLRFNRIHTNLQDGDSNRTDNTATSYFLGPGVQFMARDKFPIEVAAGVGIWGDTPETDAETVATFALQLGFGNTLYSNSSYNIAFNLLYLPFFDTTSQHSSFIVHNIMVGFQMQTH